MRDYSKISDYGLIGNTRTGALVSKEGSIDWCCFPRFDSPSLFGAVLDHYKGGNFAISPQHNFESHQCYLNDTNILETYFRSEGGSAKLTDCFPVDSEENKKGELWPLHEILRVIECTEGEFEMRMVFCPRPGYGKQKIKIYPAGILGHRCEYGYEVLYLNCDLKKENLNMTLTDTSILVHFKMRQGERAIFSLTYSEVAPAVIPPLGDEAIKRLDRTARYWKSWISKCKYKGEFYDLVKRSALALKLLAFAPSGAILAAPTTSLPERIKGERNWDYRYCWPRDASFTVRSLVDLGYYDEADAYVSWILHSTSLTRPKLEVMYSVYGDPKKPERILSWLSGYKKSKPVRIGNAATRQFQLDVYGEVMNALYLYAPYMKNIDRDTRAFFTDIGNAVMELWKEPDEGIWEVRTGRYHHTHSKAMAWIALDRLLKICREKNWDAPLDEFEKTAKEIKSSIETHGYSEELESYTAIFDGTTLDASLLMLPIMNYEPSATKRLTSTVFKIKDKLSENALIYRYTNRFDGLKGAEGAFVACSFWLVEAMAKLGFINDARKLFCELIRKKNTVGLWPEEISPTNNEYLGNYPQAFTHTGLISAALALEECSHGHR